MVKALVMNAFNLSNFIKDYYYKVSDGIPRKSIKKLLKLSLKITSFSTNETDEYLIGLRRLLNNITNFSVNYIENIFVDEERKIGNYLENQSKMLEENFEKYLLIRSRICLKRLI